MRSCASLLATAAFLLAPGACGGRAVDDGVEPLDPFCSGTSSKLEMSGTVAPFKEVRALYADISTPPMPPGAPPPVKHVNGTIVMTFYFNPEPLGPDGYSAEVVVVAPDDGDASPWWQPAGLDLGLADGDLSTRVTLTSVSRTNSGSATASFSTDKGLVVQGTLRAQRVSQADPLDVRLSLCLACQHPTSGWLPVRLYTPPVGP